MVQSLGISVGNLNSYVAAGQGGGIEILLNEYSNRSTPSMVAFTDHSRSMGVDASSNFFMNLKNTVYDLMMLVGKPFKEIDTSQYPFRIEESSDGQALIAVRHLGEERKFTVTQVLAMLFTKLKDVANNASDCVISCPQFFTETQKSELFHAALIAGLKPLQIISDMSAVILNYAYYRTTRKDASKIIAFINFGQSNLQTVVAWLNPREDVVKILATESESIGGKDFDRLLADYFIKSHNLNLNLKQTLKLQSACEKLKKLLSANANDIPLHVESLISEDKDFTARIDRDKFEELCQPLLQRIEACIKRAATKSLEVAKALEEARMVEVARAVEAAKAAKAAKAAEEALAAEAAKVVQVAESGEGNHDTEGLQAQESAQEAGMAPESSKPTESPQAKPQPQSQSPSAESPPAPEPLRPIEIESVEMVGGSTRIPAVRQLIQNIFNLLPSTTLNTDEAVARGCVLHCATLHPGMKVKREVKVDGSELFSKPITCDNKLRQVEVHLVEADCKYKSRTERRNNLEEFIYSERSKLQEGDPYLTALNNTLEWVFSDEGENAAEEEYLNRLDELKRFNNQTEDVDMNGKE